MKQVWSFDTDPYNRITEARIQFLDLHLSQLVSGKDVTSALDAGCGVGRFAHHLTQFGLRVTALDGRAENVEEARRRYTNIRFLVQDIEDTSAQSIGSFDVVLCFGLLYHLENPFAAIRNLYAMTSKILLVESRVVPGEGPIAELVDEGCSVDQSLRYIALKPSESGLVKMLYRAGFQYVYFTKSLPNHEDFRSTLIMQRQRTILAASKIQLLSPELVLTLEPRTQDPWLVAPHLSRLERIRTFVRRPWQEKVFCAQVKLRRLWSTALPHVPLIVRLPYGGWWFDTNDTCSEAIALHAFEPDEYRFVQRFLKKGMTFLDIGAHHGFYSILAAKVVGNQGRVIAFEPSPRERQWLAANLRLNHCSRVKVEPLAISDGDGGAPFFVVAGRQTTYNSLRPPAVTSPTKTIMVETASLDSYIEREQIKRIDFVKIDAEGAELNILKGAIKSFSVKFRPLIMAEATDLRTSQWGYRASDTRDFLSRLGYRWFTVGPNGRLQPYSDEAAQENFVAIPEEKLETVQELIEPDMNGGHQYNDSRAAAVHS